LAIRFPGSRLVIGRELTKKFETIYRGTADELQRQLEREEPRGEYALALELDAASPQKMGLKEAEIIELLEELAKLGAGQKILVRVGMSHGLPKNKSYDLALHVLKALQGK